MAAKSVCEVSFKLGRAQTVPGEGVLIVGSHHAFGSWDPQSGVRMVTDEGSYPAWNAKLQVPEAAGVLEFKYVIDRQINGEGFFWEEGENRRLPLQPGSWAQHDTAFGSPGSKLTQEPQSAAQKSQKPREQAPPVITGPALGAPPPMPVPRETESRPASHVDDLPTTSEGSDASPEEKSMVSEPNLRNVPSSVSVMQGNAMQRLASLSAFDQLVDDADQMAAMRAQMEEEAAKLEDRPVRYGARHLNTPIVIVSSEMHPWSKTGGLAMIAGSYGYEFALRGHRTMAIAPMYDDYADCSCIGSKAIELAGGWHEVRYFLHRKVYGHGKVCDYVFVDHPCYRRGEGIYGPPGAEYGDNLFRFALLSLAAAEAPLILQIDGSTYGQDVLFICNDWQTGILPVYLLYKYKLHNTYMNARSWMVIHNIAYQGKYSKETFPVDSYLGLPRRLAGDDLQGEDMHLGPDCINLLAGGIRTSDRVLTVSPNYANEIRSPEGGNGLHDILQKRGDELRLAGILNGISDEWNPATDPKIPRNYRLADVDEGKRICKAALQQELGLEVDPGACLIGFCGRLCYQKGLTLINASIDWMMHGQPNRCQLIIMGKGEHNLAEQVGAAERRFKGRICGYVGFDPCVERRMMAGCDLLLMPSQFEPCGLPQMYAQMYGTLPVVHETGGLKDSVKGLWDDSHIDVATGFLFSGFDEGALKHALYTALSTFHQRKDIFKKMQGNAMRMSFYWPTAMDEYEKHVDWTMESWASRKPESWWSNHG
mmetsp:Transcript_17671/g.50879  ORF Transcript_17671/g.50879 Transcript_17671/m.50879 type:complete len:764 (+) Transcript_17671:52-2343(+)